MNKMTKEQKEWIDNANYYDLLSKWRFAPIGDEMFQGKTGLYYGKIMNKRRDEVSPAEHTAISKAIGWLK